MSYIWGGGGYPPVSTPLAGTLIDHPNRPLAVFFFLRVLRLRGARFYRINDRFRNFAKTTTAVARLVQQYTIITNTGRPSVTRVCITWCALVCWPSRRMPDGRRQSVAHGKRARRNGRQRTRKKRRRGLIRLSTDARRGSGHHQHTTLRTHQSHQRRRAKRFVQTLCAFHSRAIVFVVVVVVVRK